MVVKVVANKGVEYKEYKKDGKHRIYFKDSQGQGRPVEIGNYDLVEGRFFSDRKYGGTLIGTLLKMPMMQEH